MKSKRLRAKKLLGARRGANDSDDVACIFSGISNDRTQEIEQLSNALRALDKMELFLNAIRMNNVEAVNRLLHDHRFLNPSVDDNEAIKLAAELGSVQIVDLLMNDPRVDPAVDGDTPLVIALVKNHPGVVMRLIQDPRVNTAVENNALIHWAAAHNHIKVVERLIHDPRVDLTSGNNTALCTAALRGHLEVVNLLLRNRDVNPAAQDNLPIRYAAKKGHVRVVDRLLEDSRVNPAARKNAAIRSAAKNHHRKVVERLLVEPAVLAGGNLPRPDPYSDDPIARMLGDIIEHNSRVRLTVERRLEQQSRVLAEMQLAKSVMKYYSGIPKSRRER